MVEFLQFFTVVLVILNYLMIGVLVTAAAIPKGWLDVNSNHKVYGDPVWVRPGPGHAVMGVVFWPIIASSLILERLGQLALYTSRYFES